MQNNLKLAIFDMDGLMFDTEREYCEATLELVTASGITVNEQVLWEAIGSTEFDIDRFFVSGVPEGLDKDALLEKAVEDRVERMCTEGVPKKRGLDELLEWLTARGIRMVVATSTARPRATRLLTSADVLKYFDFIVTRQDVARGKPEPDIFLKTCELAGVLPSEAMVLEDSVNGAKAALAANIPCVVVPDIVPIPQQLREHVYAVVESLLEVPDLIEH